MNQSRRLTPIALGVAAILVLAGSVGAAALLPSVTGQPNSAQASPETKQAPSAEKIQRILDRLGKVGIKATADEFKALAEKYGVGGAIRVLAFADAAGTSTADITAMFDSGKGWGEIRRELGLTIGPGLGWIMGQGPDKAEKVDKVDKDASGDDDPDD